MADIIVNSAEGETDEECDSSLESFTKRGVPVVVCGRSGRGRPFDEAGLLPSPAVTSAVREVARELCAANQRETGIHEYLGTAA